MLKETNEKGVKEKRRNEIIERVRENERMKEWNTEWVEEWIKRGIVRDWEGGGGGEEVE